ncbi:MAG TPA: uracil-DNA glycosylase, partial [Blastocatellia bacterium]
MNPQEELMELIAQAKEHLRYYGELGLTHIGDTPGATASEPKLQEPAAPAIIHPPQFAPKPTSDMPTKQENSTTASLFGETEPESAETQYANETLEDIRRDLGDCQRCKLFSTRTNLVFGEGAPRAELMFVGEGPGADEDATGRPFVGRAGQLLTKMIEAIDLKRDDVYIANVVKSRPPGNRAPESDEVKACIPFLFRQIAAIRPKLIVALGNPAMQALLDTKIGITKMRGQFQDYQRIPGIKVLPTFHP